MKKLIVLVAALMLFGCAKMSNQEIINQTKFCEENGLEAKVLVNGWTNEIVKVQCFPKKSK
jgi:uncharacterized lipoprotein YajG